MQTQPTRCFLNVVPHSSLRAPSTGGDHPPPRPPQPQDPSKDTTVLILTAPELTFLVFKNINILSWVNDHATLETTYAACLQTVVDET